MARNQATFDRQRSTGNDFEAAARRPLIFAKMSIRFGRNDNRRKIDPVHLGLGRAGKREMSSALTNPITHRTSTTLGGHHYFARA